ncbi:hypothetical protein ACJIZ3_024370 [Penstemon smallii]|uniref:DUF4378 domain-containing protein n=1 Tax=Penstemon smallii TaxID=265156 RepID=A0ABD3TRM1_9LAMI
MMANKQQQQQLLHELLKEDQEPFRLKSYISDKRSQVKNPTTTTTLQLKKTKSPMIPATKRGNNNNLCKHACFLSFKNSPKSPFLDFHSPAVMSPCNKSPNGAVFLHIPSRTAALLVEAAMRIQKQNQSKPRTKSKGTGFGLFGSFLKRLKDRSKSKKRVTGNNEFSVLGENEKKVENKSSVDMDQASTSSCCSECLEEINNDFDYLETRYCYSPFRFSLHKSPPSSTGVRTPEFCSPAGSPSRLVKQEKEICETRNSNNVKSEEEEEEKEQCSPVSILDPPFEDDGHESEEAEEDDYDLECSFANVQRAKHQLLRRLRRFEELANLDPMELERKLLEGSEGEEQVEEEEEEESENDEPLSLYRNIQNVDTFVTEVFNQTDLQNHSKKMSDDMKRLVSDLIVEERNKIICPGTKEVVFGRICNKLDSWKEVEFDTIDMMIDLDFKREFDGWRKCTEQGEEVVKEIELEIFGLLIEELSEDMFSRMNDSCILGFVY